MRRVISSIATGLSLAVVNGWEAAMRRGPVLWLTLCGALLVAGIFAVTAVTVGDFRERTLVNRERELANTVQLLARHFDQQFEDADTVAADLIEQINLAEITSPAMFRERMTGPVPNRFLRDKISSVSYLGDIVIYDSEGEILNWSRAQPPPKINIASRAYFQTFKTDPTSKPLLMETVQSFVIGRLTTIVARRLTLPDGTFVGVMVRRIDPESYQRYFASVSLPDGAAISLFDSDGKMMARYPYSESLIGKTYRNAPLMQEVLAAGGQQTIRHKSPVDGQDRLGSAALLAHFPLVIVATHTTAAALADWRQQTGFMVATATLSAAVIALILFLIIRQIKRQNHEAQQRIEAERQRLDTAMNNMTQGLVLYDAEGRLVICNRRYREMYHLTEDDARSGCSFHDVLRLRRDRGTFSGNIDEIHARVLKNVATGQPGQAVLETGDGRVFQALYNPLVQGGWITTVEDITERRNLEQERDRTQTFLREIIDHIPSQITVKDARTRQYLLINGVAELQFGQPRQNIVGRTAFDIFPEASARIITADDDEALQSDTDFFRDEHPWQSMGMGARYITSRRIGIRDEHGEPRYVINVVDDVTERRRANDKIAHMAHYDALTELPNRVLFREQMHHELEKVAGGAKFALLYIDVDEFKGINDSLGHHVGDELLKAVAARIRTCLKEDDLIARLGGDEFAVIRTGIASSEDALAFVTTIHEAIRRPYHCLGHQLSTDASIGIALAPQDGTDIDQLVKNADLAMYGAKAGGRRTHRFFVPEMDASARSRLRLEQDLRQALADGGFDIHYQPLVDLKTGAVSGCEALLRWHHPERGWVSPAEFIPIAEDTGLINELGDWVLRTACNEAATWPSHVRIAVNVSPVQLKSDTLALRIAGALAASGLSPSRLELEITEAVLIRDDEAALSILHQLRSIGVRIALDDFGTGYSSLSYLKRFPFDKIKIDRCFVADIADASGAPVIVQAVVNIAAASNMTTVAEGVETESQREMLRGLGCTEMQGYLFSKPKPAAEVRELFSPGKSEPVAAVA
ncbi:EAL domain-containing protein [Bradyrhizobium diazoefficiens]|nr:EAL domain-containing protein [Bradyrhizobium diazoefficiens]UCF52206.1 MAG: EAL domain-containing protein [Bradyrhizobium sp.]MBR0968707.1 EAL domain-containing protein [Bradyrhizobium diazoefficiens]MBR0981974.1 EAL domain-containing protein [Bradyrhizobium diazoefficiens]MBR1011481.1 EAL domain-containing protein [Bradyrhizobium diazoefficiens]MBR1017834.1 EAL domain-containing protein [Bradyrhizobium diazoefficiens]